MRYDWCEHLEETQFTKAYFEEIDRRFLTSARQFMVWRDVAFDAVIPFENLADKDVLEIGVGQGTHAQLIAPRCKSFTGIGLTLRAVQATSKRLKLFGIQGRVMEMDAETMDLPANSFDFVWSWGVIHHSADTPRIPREIHRVLRPGGSCAVMIYHRSWWYYYFVCGFLKGALQGKLLARRNVHQVTQLVTDGAIARYYTAAEWRRLTAGLFDVSSVQIYGMKSDIVAIPRSRLKRALEGLMPDALTRFLTSRLRMGSFLVAQMRKA